MKTRILLIEDDKVDQKAFERFSSRELQSYDFDIAGSVAAAKKALSNQEYAVIITDYMLGDGDAFDVLQAKKDEAVIFVSGEGNEEVVIEAMHNGAHDFLIKDSSRNYLKVLPMTLDKIIKQRENSQKLKKAEVQIKKLSMVAEKTTSPVIIFDRDQNIEWVNDAFLEETNYTHEEVIGMPSGVLQRGNSPFDDEVIINKVVLNHDSHHYEAENYTRYGSKYWTQNALTPICDENGEVTNYVIVQTNLTQKKELEESLIEAKEKAIESEKAKQQFLANMSHEIRTPLNSIVGFTELLSSTHMTQRQKKYLEAINWSSGNLLQLINSILDISKIEAGRIELEKTPFAVRDLVHSCVQSFVKQMDEKGINYRIDIDPDIPQLLMGDPVRINQILTNLISNSAKFTPSGRIAVRVTRKQKISAQYQLGFEVIDTGIGIPDDKQESVFDVFTQANSDTTRYYGGTGLGLPIVKQLVELHGGHIFLTSKEGKGTKVEFVLKFDECQRIPQQKKKEGSTRIDCHKKILVVEDHEMNQLLIRATLDGQNVEYDIADNGKMAIDKLNEKAYDLILMDLHMPEMDGIKTTQVIRNVFGEPTKNIPIIAMTASAMSSDLDACLSSGMNDFISKPFQSEELFSKINKWCSTCEVIEIESV